MIVISVVLAVMTLNGDLHRMEAAILFFGLVAYTTFLFYQGRKNSEDLDSADGEVGEILSTKAPAWQNVLFVIGGLALLVLGARWLVQSAVEIATLFGVNEAVIGLTIVAAGTSLPEVVTSVVATVRGERDIAVGNVVGSNVFNILCVLGISGLVSPTPLLAGDQMAQLDIPVMLGVAILCAPLFFAGATLTRWDGVLFLTLYIAYVWYLIAVALAQPYLSTLQSGIIYGLGPLVVAYVVFTLWQSQRPRRA